VREKRGGEREESDLNERRLRRLFGCFVGMTKFYGRKEREMYGFLLDKARAEARLTMAPEGGREEGNNFMQMDLEKNPPSPP
jgi:hypothetical protein